jgi:hypothetical protein
MPKAQKDAREITCVVCGTSVVSGSNRQKYCSEGCKHGHGRCETCGMVFQRKANTSGKWCSRACWYASPHGGGVFKECPLCGVSYHTYNRIQKYCSRTCAQRARLRPQETLYCLTCREPLVGKSRKALYCSRACAGKARQTIVGERGIVSDVRGYVRVKVGVGYPGANRWGWILEHRRVLQDTLGRPLSSGERVHHRNGDRSDNRPENLELCAMGHAPGQRVRDLLAAIKIQPEIVALSDEAGQCVLAACERVLLR